MKNLTPISIVLGVLFGLFIAAAILPSAYRADSVAFILFAGLTAIVLYGTSHSDLLIRKLFMMGLGIAILGIALNFATKNPLFAVLAIASPFLVIAWFNYLRYPIYSWPVLHLYRQKKYSEAFQRINAWIDKHPGDWKAILLRSDLHLNRAQYAEAERDASLVVKLKPDSHAARVQLGRAEFAQARYREALGAYQAAYQLKPDNGHLFNMALANYRLGNFSQAADMLLKVTRHQLSLVINNLIAYYFLGRSLEHMGQTERATAAFSKLPHYAYHLKQSTQELDKLPDYPEILALRADLADIERRINNLRQSPPK